VDYVSKVITIFLLAPALVACLYQLVASPPFHLFYEKYPHAGPNSVYVPGEFKSRIGTDQFRFQFY
jgi:hypothetical protein